MNVYLLLCLFIVWFICFVILLFVFLLLVVEVEKVLLVVVEDNMLLIYIDDMLWLWRGDLSGMIDCCIIWVLIIYSKIFFFIDKGIQCGVMYDIFIVLENELNKQLVKDKKFKQCYLKLYIVFVLVSWDNFFIVFNEGKGDIVVVNLIIMFLWEVQVDFVQLFYSNVKELLIFGLVLLKVDSLE